MTLKPATAIVTGAAGFIGSHVVRRLVAEGWRVHVVCRRQTKFAKMQDVLDRVSLHDHDGTAAGMLKIVARAKPDIVFHLASLVLTEHTIEDIEPMIESNILFGTQLAEAMIRSGHFHLINTGTLAQHFDGKRYSPASLYAATKQAYENILQFYMETAPLKVVTLKLSHVFGPGDLRPKLIPSLRRAAEEQKPVVMSPGEQFIDLVYIDDVVDAFLAAAALLQAGQINQYAEYAVSSKKPIQLRQLVNAYEQAIGKKIPVIWGGRPYRPREMMVPCDSGEFLPGWQPRISLEEGLKRTDLPEGGVDREQRR